jgi:hypothetical protein
MGKYRLFVRKGWLWVRRGRATVRLAYVVGGQRLERIEWDGAARRWKITTTDTGLCGGSDFTISVDQVREQLAVARARRALAKGSLDEAKAELVAHAPAEIELLAVIERKRTGDAAAEAVLGPLFERDAVAAYLMVLENPELASLRDGKLMRSMLATASGTAKLQDPRLDQKWRFAFSPRHGRVIARLERYCGELDSTGETLEIMDPHGHQRDSTVPWVGCSEIVDGKFTSKKSRRRIAERQALIDLALSDLGFDMITKPEGFESIADEEPSAQNPAGRSLLRQRVAGRHLGIVMELEEGHVRVVRKDQILASSSLRLGFEYVQAFFLPSPAIVALIAEYGSASHYCVPDATSALILLPLPKDWNR